MPTLSHDFEVYCTCGDGICNNTNVDNKRQYLVIEPCKKCMQEKDSEIENLKGENNDLQEEIDGLKEDNKDLRNAIDELKKEIKDLEANQ
jgi:peptidoglycan hydrolase CwlO-like protein